MNITKTIIQKGDPTQLVQKYDEVAIEYTGKVVTRICHVSTNELQDGYSTLINQMAREQSKKLIDLSRSWLPY
jgi:hypothetical protein